MSSRRKQNHLSKHGKRSFKQLYNGYFTDRESTIWITTNEKGINRVTKQVITPISTADGLPDKNVYPILEDGKGSFWIGSSSSLSNYKDGKFTNYARREGLRYEIVQSLLEDREGRLWIGSIGGVEYLENGKFTDFTEKLGIGTGEVDFWDIHQTASGVLWFGTSKGAFKYENGAATRYRTAEGLPGNDVKAIHEAHDGSIWFGTYSGLAHLKDGKFESFTENEGLAGNHIRTIYEDAENALWIGTYESGLSRFKDGKFTNYTTDNGLFSNGVFQILEDGRGNFWMSSNQGIYRVSRGQLNDFAAGKVATITSTFFGKSDGMLNRECNGGRQPAGIKAKDGRLWFPTPIVVGQTTVLTASFLRDSANNVLTTANISRLIGLAITFNGAVRGTLSGAQTTIQASGTATATFTANSAGAGSANAIVDNQTTTASITINKANTAITMNSDTPDPTITGQSYTVTFNAPTVTSPGAGTPTGTVTVSDGSQTCMATLPTLSCNLTSTTAGAKNLTATYNGDANFNASPASASISHRQLTKAVR